MAITPSAVFSAFSTINNLLNSFTAVDVVSIRDNVSFGQLFSDARPLKAEVKETAQVMRHPVENGSVLADYKIINPIEINMSVIVKADNYNSTYVQLRHAFFESTALAVQTRTAVYNNMIIADMPHVEDTDITDGVIIGLHFVEVRLVLPANTGSSTPSNFAPIDLYNSDTVQAGLKYPTTLSGSTSNSAQQAISLPAIY